MSRNEVLLRVRELNKRYGTIEACRDMSFEIRRGELFALVGDNGAGKSTVAKIISGAVQPDSGTIEIDGDPVRFSTPLEARRSGVAAVFQELALAPNLDVSLNIFLGQELRKRLVPRVPIYQLDRRAMARVAELEVKRLRIGLPDVRGIPVGSMSGGQRQAVAIARATHWSSRLLVMDEPTAALGVKEARAVLDLIGRVLESGVAVLMISHAMPHVVELADHVVVLRHGAKVADLARGEFDVGTLVRAIVGE